MGHRFDFRFKYYGAFPCKGNALYGWKWIFDLIHITNLNHVLNLGSCKRWRIFCKMTDMMTRRDVLDQLKRVGIHELSLLKRDCREFENYMAVYYGYKIQKMDSEAKPALSAQNTTSPSPETSPNLRPHRRNCVGPPFSPPRIKSEQNRGQ